MKKSTTPIISSVNSEHTYQAPWLAIDSSTKKAKNNGVHFSGANGFPVASYDGFFKLIQPRLNITAMDSRGAWPQRQKPPKNFSMHSFADDLIAGIKDKHSHPIVGMGHSHGGQSTLIAALKQPTLFTKLIIIESASLPNPYIDLIYRQLPKQVLFKLFPFMRGSEMRKRVWPTRTAFIERYKAHSTFKHFTEEAINDYAQHGLFERQDGQFELVFDPVWESYIFRNIEFMWKFLRKTTHPTLLIRAEHSTLYSSAQFQKHNKRLPSNIHAIEIPNTHHLMPFENPQALASVILDWLK